MESLWFKRLEQAIRADGRPMREISLAAGLGPNYVQQMLKEPKEPGAGKLVSLLSVLDGPTALFVLTGMTASAEDLEFLDLMRSMPPEVKARALDLFAALQAGEAE